jgi:cytochrome c5
MPITERALWLLILIAGLAAACGKSSAPAADASPAAAPSAATAAPAKPAEPFNLAAIFPAGAGRDLVLDTCGTCHPVVCAARGQRTAERWDSIRKGHQDKLTAQSAANVNVMFAYLKQNFNETKPEPKIPPELLQQGCTPF